MKRGLLFSILSLIIIVAVLSGCGQLFSRDTDTTPTTPPLATRTVDISIISTGLPGSVNIAFHYGNNLVQYNGQVVPWTYSYTPYQGEYIRIDVENLDDNGDVTLVVTIDGSPWKSLTSYGAYCEVSTSGYIPWF
jgi:hypothetical protein